MVTDHDRLIKMFKTFYIVAVQEKLLWDRMQKKILQAIHEARKYGKKYSKNQSAHIVLLYVLFSHIFSLSSVPAALTFA